MSWFLSLLSIALSFISTCMMSYIAMAVVMAPWVAPVVAIVLMIFVLQFVKQKWFKKYVVISVSAGSVGGMVGMCLGLTWPSLYFLHQDMFLLWMQTPWKFAGRVSLVVFSSGVLAFLIAHFLRHHLIVKQKLRFPISQLVHNIIFVDDTSRGFVMMVNGVVASSSWNVFTWVARQSMRTYMVQLHAIPVLLSIGFVAGQSISVPLLLGMASRVLSVIFVKNIYFLHIKQQDFIFTFSAGMLIGFLIVGTLKFFWNLYKKGSLIDSDILNLLLRNARNKYYCFGLLFSLMLGCAALFVWGVSWAQQLYVLSIVFLLGSVSSVILGKIGVIDIQGFVNFMILPFTYFFYAQSSATLFVIAFATVCIGVVVDLLFSYKLAHLSKIPHRLMLQYQLLGFVTSAVTVGFVLWWYIHSFTLGSSYLLAQQALSQEIYITFSDYDYHILIIGAIYAGLLSFISSELLVIVGGVTMPLFMSFWLVLAGGLSYLIKKRSNLYPLCFGVYASHSVWMIIRALLFVI